MTTTSAPSLYEARDEVRADEARPSGDQDPTSHVSYLRYEPRTPS